MQFSISRQVIYIFLNLSIDTQLDIAPFTEGLNQMNTVLCFTYLKIAYLQALSLDGFYLRKLFWKGPRTLWTWVVTKITVLNHYSEGIRTLQKGPIQNMAWNNGNIYHNHQICKTQFFKDPLQTNYTTVPIHKLLY